MECLPVLGSLGWGCNAHFFVTWCSSLPDNVLLIQQLWLENCHVYPAAVFALRCPSVSKLCSVQSLAVGLTLLSAVLPRRNSNFITLLSPVLFKIGTPGELLSSNRIQLLGLILALQCSVVKWWKTHWLLILGVHECCVNTPVHLDMSGFTFCGRDVTSEEGAEESTSQ